MTFLAKVSLSPPRLCRQHVQQPKNEVASSKTQLSSCWIEMSQSGTVQKSPSPHSGSAVDMSDSLRIKFVSSKTTLSSCWIQIAQTPYPHLGSSDNMSNNIIIKINYNIIKLFFSVIHNMYLYRLYIRIMNVFISKPYSYKVRGKLSHVSLKAQLLKQCT